MISLPATILIALAWVVMLTGVVYYIVRGSKGELNILKSFLFILSFVTAGAILVVIAMFVA